MNNIGEPEMNSNADERAIAVYQNASSSDISETNSSVESVANEIESVDFESPALASNIGRITIRESSDVTIGNRIIYNGPVTIHQNQSDHQRSDSNQMRFAELLNRSGELQYKVF